MNDDLIYLGGIEPSELDKLKCDKMFCPNCEKDVSTTISKHIDCDDCRGTGIGYPPPETECGICKGRGYLIVEPYHICDECNEAILD